MDWAEACRILGVSESATEVEIKEQYIYKAQLLHPDKNVDKPLHFRKKAEAELSLVNQAYKVLNNTGNNPYKVPPKLAVEPMGIRFKDINPGERKQTTFTIRNVGGPYTSIWLDNKPAPWLTVTGVKSTTGERLPIEVALECTGMGEPGKRYICDLLIKLENENTHTLDQKAVKIELSTRPRSSEFRISKKLDPPAKISVAEVPGTKPASQPLQKNIFRFSTQAFLVDILAFAVLGILGVYIVRTFLKLDEMVFIIGLICYITITFGISFNHSLIMGSKTVRPKAKNQTIPPDHSGPLP